MPDNNTNNNRKTRKPANVAFDSGLGHLPPQSLETERLVLGALMIDKDAFTVVSEILRQKEAQKAKHSNGFRINKRYFYENVCDIHLF